MRVPTPLPTLKTGHAPGQAYEIAARAALESDAASDLQIGEAV